MDILGRRTYINSTSGGPSAVTAPVPRLSASSTRLAAVAWLLMIIAALGTPVASVAPSSGTRGKDLLIEKQIFGT